MKGAIACGHVKTAEVAKDILDAGGNAFDAAIAALFAMFIAEPCMASLGGSGFATMKTTDSIRVLDFFCQTPRSDSKERSIIPVEVNFGGSSESFFGGHGSVAVPGIPACIDELFRNFATLPFRELLQPAIDLCKSGVELNWFQRYDIELLQEFLALSPYQSRHLFENGKPKKTGSLIKMPELASTLDYLAHEGIEDFYRGDIAKLFFAEHENEGGIQNKQDWEEYKAEWYKPAKFSFLDFEIYTSGLPSLGGLWMQLFLEQWEKNKFSSLSAEHLNLLVKSYIQIRNYRKHPQKLQQLYPSLENNVHWQNFSGTGTSHFNIADRWNNCISLTTTIGAGSGVFIGETGIHMNNMLGETALMPKGINSYIPNSRLHSNTCPTIAIAKNKERELILGSGGSARIPFAISQAIINHISLKMNLEDAIEAPRLYDDMQQFQVEPGFDVEADGKINVWSGTNLYFGGVHAILKKGNQLQASADKRREGFSIILN